jgi:hypothetical protein
LTRDEYEDRRKRPFYYCSWKGCNGSVASSIERFSKIRTARLAKNPRWNPASSLASIIDADWSQYIRALKIPFFEDQLEELLLIDVRTSSGSKKELRAAEFSLDQSGKAISARGLQVLKAIADEMTSNDSSLDGPADEVKVLAECEWHPAQKELLASLDSIIAVLGLCRRFLPDPARQHGAKANVRVPDDKQSHPRPVWFGALDRGLLSRYETEMEFDSDKSNSPLCNFSSGSGARLCNELTEFESYRQGHILDDHPGTLLRRLSTRRCTAHRNVMLIPPWWELDQIDPEEQGRSDLRECFTAADSLLGSFCEISAVRHRQTCRLCPRRSELWAAMRSGEEFNTHLSSDFCRHHRPQQQDGSWRRSGKTDLERSTYESRVAKVRIYRLEFARLNAHAHFAEQRLRTGSNPAPDLFAQTVIAKSQIYADEHFELARVAWHLVEHDVNDRKKEIIMRVASRHSQTAIAKDLGISRQAVHEALKSIPKCFRFDLPTEKQDEPQFATPLPASPYGLFSAR